MHNIVLLIHTVSFDVSHFIYCFSTKALAVLLFRVSRHFRKNLRLIISYICTCVQQQSLVIRTLTVTTAHKICLDLTVANAKAMNELLNARAYSHARYIVITFEICLSRNKCVL